METPVMPITRSNGWRRRVQFSLRSLLLLTLLMAAASAWLAEGLARARRQRAAVKHLQQFPGRIWYEYQIGTRAKEPPYPAWARDLLGDDYFASVESVCLGGREKFTDVDLAYMRDFPELKSLRLSGAHITDGGLAHLSNLPALEDLSLAGTQITDAGLVHLGRMDRLQRLWLNRTAITDEGLIHLRQLKSLKLLNVQRSQITPAGCASLKASLADCEFVF